MTSKAKTTTRISIGTPYASRGAGYLFTSKKELVTFHKGMVIAPFTIASKDAFVNFGSCATEPYL